VGEHRPRGRTPRGGGPRIGDPDGLTPTPVPRSAEDVTAFLAAHHGAPVTDVKLLSGGSWSAAYGYRAGDRELVLRLGQSAEWFGIDRDAMAYAREDLPVPAVLEIGEAFRGAYAISERAYGRFLESVEVDEAEVAGPTLMTLLDALRSVPDDGRLNASWRGWLVASLRDDPSREVSGWRATLAADPALDRLYRACEARIHELLDACPERRDLVHRDLLHANVLLTPDASRVNAVFSWKCSVRGDFLYDVALCTFWGALAHPGIEAIDTFGRTLATAPAGDLLDAASRHHCYELHIGTEHLGWYAWTGDDHWLRTDAAHLEMLLERGPLI
jgi:aminoglycoside phosphotransferase (APT) family kinase protein